MNKTTLLSKQEIIDIFSASSVPIAVYTTGSLRIEAVTDAMLGFWGKNRTVIGLPLHEAVPELAGQRFLAELISVIQTGEPVFGTGVPAVLAVENHLQTRYFDYEYRALRNAAGAVYGVLHTATEVTDRVLGKEAVEQGLHDRQMLENEQNLNEELAAANEELSSINKELSESRQNLAKLNAELEERVIQRTQAAETAKYRLEAMVMNTPIAMTILRGYDLVVEVANQPMLDVWRRSLDQVLGKSLLEIFPVLKDQPNPDRMRGVMRSGQRFSLPETEVILGTIDGILKKHYARFSYDPIFEPDGTVGSIVVTVINITEEVLNRRQLQESTEELAASNEELMASNEELLRTQDHLQQTVTHLAESESRFRFLLNAVPHQVWTATPDGALNYVNEVISSEFGQDMQTIVGEGWQAFVHADDLPEALEKWQRSLKSRKQYLTEFRLKFADGNYYWHLARALPLVEKRKVSLWIGTNTNIHEQKIKDAKKDEFISIASHELKTPLTTIKAFFQLSKRDVGNANPFVTKAERQLERLGRLIEDLLDVSKINAGKMSYNREEFDFGQILRRAVASVQQTAAKHRIELMGDAAVMYRGDQHRIEQVLVNLLNNAVKYSPDADQVIVHQSLEGRNLIVSVQDFGIGIPEEHLQGLFDRFYRVDNSSARFQGLGLGLFISNEIVKRHGGSFWIESTPGKGSTFYLLLPLNGQQEFEEIATDGLTYYEGSYINVKYQPENNYLYADWLGYQNYDSVVKGCGVIQDLMQKNNCRLVINDNTKVKGNWSEASDWGAEVWFPAMAESGLRKFAWIHSPSTFSRIAANKSLPPAYDALQIAFFDQKENALNWLIGS